MTTNPRESNPPCHSVVSEVAKLRIVVEGEMWNGSTPLACARGLRALGHTVAELNSSQVFPQWRSLALRALLRALEPFQIREYNDRVVRFCEEFRPHLFLTVKGLYLTTGTLDRLRSLQIALYNFYPDTSLSTHRHGLRQTIQHFDCVFVTKHFQVRDAAEWEVRDCRYVPHGYDPYIHRPLPICEAEKVRRGAPVLFTATHTNYKEKLLAELVDRLPGLEIKIYGNGWDRCRSSNIRSFVQGWAPTGDEYSSILQCAAINLAIMSGPVTGASQGDEVSTRTFEIPACMGFMLHERTPELKTFFEEGREVACFESPRELAEQISFFLGKPELRNEIAAAAYKRSVPAYSYEARVKQILSYHLVQPNENMIRETARSGSRGRSAIKPTS